MGNQQNNISQKDFHYLDKKDKIKHLQKLKRQIEENDEKQKQGFNTNIKYNQMNLMMKQYKKEKMEDFEQQLMKQKMIQHPIKKQKKESKYRAQYFQCPVCTQEFNVFDRAPMMICMNQHTYCKICINQYFPKINQCPECRQPYNKKLVTKHRLLFSILMDEDDQLLMRIIQQEIRLQEQKLILRQKYLKKKDINEKQEIKVQEKAQRVINPQQEQYIDSQYRQYIQKGKNLYEIPTLRLQPLLLVVNLDNNRITKIQGLDHLKQLKMLSLNYNLIEQIKNLQQLPQLRFLFLKYNRIRIVQNLIDLPSIRQVYLQNNNISKKNNKQMIVALREKGIDMHY